MARSSPGLRLLIAALGAFVVLHLAIPQSTFVAPPTPAAVNALGSAAAVASGAMYNPDMMDSQIMLARVMGGAEDKKKGYIEVQPYTGETIFTDQQISLWLLSTIFMGLIALDGFKRRMKGEIDIEEIMSEKNAGRRGDITPLQKRIIESGNWG
eukprot:TRINITY_DN959_c0_g2_i3.p1 TRINITY_DN959_c0_g2~~TRINITY_DN959_c0_g2_i3.p1  ORF type:complete len:175 (-),score=40.98 TRINITY_DN959_c0_g2_i3:108-569(-)